MKSAAKAPWLTILLAPAMLTIVLFGGRLLDSMPELLGEAHADSAIPVVQTRHRHIADHLYGVDFFDAHNGIATGYYGTVLRTRDGGENWSWHTTGERELLRRVHMTSADQAFAVGHRGSIYRTPDGGSSWVVVHRQPDIKLRAIEFEADKLAGWAVGSIATILRTEDGGLSWAPVELKGYPGRDLPTWNGLAVTNNGNTIVLAGEFGMLAFSDDAGLNWVFKEAPTGTTLTDIAVTPFGYLAVGLDGTAVAITRVAGEFHLQTRSTGTIEHLFALSVDAEGEGVVVGRSTVLKLAGDGFADVSTRESVELPYNWFAGIDVTPTGELWAVGRRGLIAGSPSEDEALRALFRIGSSAPTHDATNLRGSGL